MVVFESRIGLTPLRFSKRIDLGLQSELRYVGRLSMYTVECEAYVNPLPQLRTTALELDGMIPYLSPPEALGVILVQTQITIHLWIVVESHQM